MVQLDPPVATRVGQLAPGRLFRLLSEGHKYDAIDMALGVPERPVPSPVLIDEACAALRSGVAVNQYEAPEGNLALRSEIARRRSTPTDPATMVTVTAGATEGLFVAVLATVNPGDEVVILEPYYENFINAVALAGGIPRLVRMRQPDWCFDPDEMRAAFGPRTRAIVVSTPNNPTGHMLTAEELGLIGELCQRWDAVAIADEMYSGFAYAGHDHISVAEVPALAERSFVVESFSKSQAISGWRIGYLVASPALTAAVRPIHVAANGGAAAPLQQAVARAAALDPDFGRPDDDLARQRDLTVRMFERLGLRCIPPDGGCYTMANLGPFSAEGCEDFAFRLVKEAGVMVAPGVFFHPEGAGGADLVRIAFNRDLDTLAEVERRLARLAAPVGA